MPKAAFLIPGSPNAAFFSQVAAISHSLRSLSWTNWQYSIHAFFGGQYSKKDLDILSRWMPYLQDVDIKLVSQASHAKHENWAQCDQLMLLAPRDAHVLVSLDADTLPVADLEDILNQVHQDKCIAGVTAHFPCPSIKSHEAWQEISKTFIDKKLSFDFEYSLVKPEEHESRRQAPFYLNGGVVFYSRPCFNKFINRYLSLRKKLMMHMKASHFSAQVSTTLAIIDLDIPMRSLPMRYNYPNDPLAEEIHPGEGDHVAIYHFLRRNKFDRHKIFTSEEAYNDFMSLELTGPNKRFQQSVKDILGESYPFTEHN